MSLRSLNIRTYNYMLSLHVDVCYLGYYSTALKRYPSGKSNEAFIEKLEFNVEFSEPKFMFTFPFKMKIACNYSLTANFFGNLTLIFSPSYSVFLGVLISKHACYYMTNYIIYLFQLLLLIYFLMI